MLIKHHHQRGLSLVESMIALLVISIGLLGIASLQITAMKLNNSALHHSQSVWIAYNIADRIRANFGSLIDTRELIQVLAIHRIALPVPVPLGKWLLRMHRNGRFW